jgi:hypothetical protein
VIIKVATHTPHDFFTQYRDISRGRYAKRHTVP